jgi:hypothetical protein
MVKEIRQSGRPPEVFQKRRSGRKWPWVALALVLAAAAGLNHYYQWIPYPPDLGVQPASKPRTGDVAGPAENDSSQSPSDPADSSQHAGDAVALKGGSTGSSSTEAVDIPDESKVIDYDKIKERSDQDLEEKIAVRKDVFGLDDSVDMVVGPEESIRVGEETVPLEAILDQIKAQEQGLGDGVGSSGAGGDAAAGQSAGSGAGGGGSGLDFMIVTSGRPSEEAPDQTQTGDPLSTVASASASAASASRSFPAPSEERKANQTDAPSHRISRSIPLSDQALAADPGQPRKMSAKSTRRRSLVYPAEAGSPRVFRKSINYYGVRVVRPGDNLWDIHFDILREYLGHRGVRLEPGDDESQAETSTPVARVLKYAEGMVYIFNMKTKKLDRDLYHLQPEEKVVVFNLSNLHRILGDVDPKKFETVQFDGQDLYFPEDRPVPAGDDAKTDQPG